LLKLENIKKTYPAPSGDNEVSILKKIDLEIAAGDSVAIIGPSGSGKSTLLNIIGTLDKPSSGRVFLQDQDITTLSEKEIAKIRNAEIGFIFQQHHLLPQCTVVENVLLPTLLSSNTNTSGRAKYLLDLVGLGDHLHHRPAQLSGGEHQRVAVVRALINNPKLLLADEPTGSLDHANSENLANILIDLNKKENVTLVVVTHSVDLANKMKIAYLLEDGKLRLGDGLKPSPTSFI